MAVRVREGVSWRVVDGEVIVLDRRNWAYLSVNDSGALLWEALAAGATAADLVAALVREFGIEEERARDDVERFVATLRAHDLIAPDG